MTDLGPSSNRNHSPLPSGVVSATDVRTRGCLREALRARLFGRAPTGQPPSRNRPGQPHLSGIAYVSVRVCEATDLLLLSWGSRLPLVPWRERQRGGPTYCSSPRDTRIRRSDPGSFHRNVQRAPANCSDRCDVERLEDRVDADVDALRERRGSARRVRRTRWERSRWRSTTPLVPTGRRTRPSAEPP